MNNQLLSVVIPTFNRAALLPETIYCLIRQDYRPVELIVIDDCSTDNTVKVVQRLKPMAERENVTLWYERLKKNRGAPYARNLGLNLSSGHYVYFNDSDDLVEPQKLKLQVEALAADASLDFVYGPVKILETGVVVFGARFLDPLEACIRQLRSPFFHTQGPVFRRAFLERSRLWDTSLPCCQDWEYHLALSYRRPNYRWIPDAIAYYRSNGQGLEGRVSVSRNEQHASRRYVLGQCKRIDSAIRHAPDWAIGSTRFRWSLRWNAYRVVSLCLKRNSTNLAEAILAQLDRKNIRVTPTERLTETSIERSFRWFPTLFRVAFDTCDFAYYRFYGLSGRVQRLFGRFDGGLRNERRSAV